MKAILVIDMPKSCGQCPCVSFKTDKFECQWRHIDNPDTVQTWCPLKPMPERKPEDFMEYWFNRGYNTLHEELFGDE